MKAHHAVVCFNSMLLVVAALTSRFKCQEKRAVDLSLPGSAEGDHQRQPSAGRREEEVCKRVHYEQEQRKTNKER